MSPCRDSAELAQIMFTFDLAEQLTGLRPVR
jgi:hypothetical protein